MTLNLSLPDTIEKFIEEQVASKGYSSSTEYILYLIHQEQARTTRIESLLLSGLDSGNSIKVNDDWWEQKRTLLVQKLDLGKQ
jgi:antitoxin ParD1/3/4